MPNFKKPENLPLSSADYLAEKVAAIWDKNKSPVKLSTTSKLNAKSWSLQALDTCPASKKADGELVDACKGCYATIGFYVYSSSKAVRQFNKEAWQHESFVPHFVAALYKERFFRWFDSGDMYSLALAEKIYSIMQQTPHVRHWLPTRMYKFDKFKPILSKMAALPNVVVRLSSDNIDGQTVQNNLGCNTSSIIPAEWVDDHNGFICPAYNQDGRCMDCYACYNKDVLDVSYVGHGLKMKKQHKLITALNV